VKQIAQYQDGRLELQEVPLPTPPPGGALVRTFHSVVSAGTEKMKVEQAKMNLLQKAKARPDQVRKVLQTAKTLGWQAAVEKVRNRLETPSPLGYSAAGEVVSVDAACSDYRVGDRVACAGAECAFHAEYLAMPPLLMAHVPSEVPMWQAAYATIASIAMQGLRQAELPLGSRAVVIGQGLLGVLLTNLLEAAGIRVLGSDLLTERRSAVLAVGAEQFANAGEVVERAREWTHGMGADAVFLCTSTGSNRPVEQAVEMLRDRGRIIVLGNTHVTLDWKTVYAKELEVRYSRSYGPGRYDASYEWGGIDYPVGYVRWTEQRNMESALHLMACGKLHLDIITSLRVPFSECQSVYEKLLSPDDVMLGVVLDYDAVPPEIALPKVPLECSPALPLRLLKAIPRLHVIGAGNFARTMLLPHAKGRIALGGVANHTGLSACHVAKKFGFSESTTDSSALIKNAAGEAILIATRHHLHAPFVLQALQNGAHVFVEKPLCLTEQELESITACETGSVMVGFNRRFAPATQFLRERLLSVAGPKNLTITINAGRLDPAHWYANLAESGGRVVGEACHFFDLARYLVGSRVVQIATAPVGKGQDGIAALISFADDSTAQILYAPEGDAAFSKESLTCLAPSFAAHMTNFLEITIFQNGKSKRQKFSSKGHAEEMRAWLEFLAARAEHPLPLADSSASMELTFAALQSLRENRTIHFS